MDQGQLGSSSFSLSKTLTNTSTPKDVHIDTSLQSKQKSTIKPDKPLTSNFFGNQQNVVDEIYISDSDEKEKEIKFRNWIPPTVNQRVRKKTQQTMNQEYIRNNTYIKSLNENNDNHDHHDVHWDQQMYNYHDLKDEMTEKVKNHTNKLIDNIENKFRKINENMERKQDEALQSLFNRFEITINDICNGCSPCVSQRKFYTAQFVLSGYKICPDTSLMQFAFVNVYPLCCTYRCINYFSS